MGVNVNLVGSPTAPIVWAGTDNVVTCKTYPDTARTTIRVDFSQKTGTAGIRTVTVYRTVAGVDVGAVRGLDGRFAPRGICAGIDGEPPLRAPITYLAVGVREDGTVVTSSAVVVTVPSSDAWLRSLSTPGLSVRLSVAAYPDWEADLDSYVQYAIGGKYAQVAVGARRAGTGTLVVNTRTIADRDALEALTDPVQPVYLLQPSAQSGDRDRYVTIGKTQVARPFQYTALPKRVTTLPLTETDRPDTAGWSVSIPGGTFGEAPSVPVSSLSGRIVDYGF